MVPGFQPTEVMEDPAWLFNLEEREGEIQLLDDRTDPDMPELADSSEEDDDESSDRIASLVSSSDSGVEQEFAGGTIGEDADIPNLLDPDLHEDEQNVLDGESDEDCDNDPGYNFDCKWIEKYTEPLLEPSDERMLVLPDLVLELESKNIEFALVDSGSFAHVCPISFGADYPIRLPVRE